MEFSPNYRFHNIILGSVRLVKLLSSPYSLAVTMSQSSLALIGFHDIVTMWPNTLWLLSWDVCDKGIEGYLLDHSDTGRIQVLLSYYQSMYSRLGY